MTKLFTLISFYFLSILSDFAFRILYLLILSISSEAESCQQLLPGGPRFGNSVDKLEQISNQLCEGSRSAFFNCFIVSTTTRKTWNGHPPDQNNHVDAVLNGLG